MIESFENYDIAHAPLRVADIGQTDYQLLIDVRRFRIAMDSEPTVEVGSSARIVDRNGNVIASRLFEDSQKFKKVEPPVAVAAFDDAFAPGLCRLFSSGRIAQPTLFEGFQIGQQVIDLVRIELERRHCRMTGLDAFGESLGEGFDGVAQMQGSEWWHDLERTLSDSIDGVAPRAIVERERLAALLGRRAARAGVISITVTSVWRRVHRSITDRSFQLRL